MFGPLRGHDGGHGGGRAEWYADRWGGVPKTERGVSHAARRFFAVVVRVSRSGPSAPNRASGEGEDGSDPPIFAAGAARLSGGCGTRCTTRCPTPHPPFGRSLPSSCIRAGRLPARARAGRGAATRRLFLLTGGGMSSWCGWHWRAVFLVDDPVAVLAHCRTPNLYRAVVAWQCIAPAAIASRRHARPRGIGKTEGDHLPARPAKYASQSFIRRRRRSNRSDRA